MKVLFQNVTWTKKGANIGCMAVLLFLQDVKRGMKLLN